VSGALGGHGGSGRPGGPDPRREPFRRYLSAWIGFSAGGQFSQALAVAIVLYAFSAHAVRGLIGWPGSIAVLASLVVLAAFSLVGARHRIEWHGILPVSLLALFGLMALSVLWSRYTWISVGGVAYAVGFGALGLYLALGRDLVQVVRATGDGLRILLVTSLALEVLSGILVDQPFPFLGIQGNLALGGPIQGLPGTRNALGFLAALAAVTFAVEYLTRSVPRPVAGTSLALAAVTLVFASSPTTAVAVLVLAVAGLALSALRRAPTGRRPAIQVVLGAFVVAGLALAWFGRRRLLDALGAGGDVATRTTLWDRMRGLISVHEIQGWGFVGQWPTDVFPFVVLTSPSGRPHETGLNAWYDVWLQLGLAGLLVLVAAGTLAFVRSWAIASGHPIVAYVWPALVLLLVGVVSFAESFVLTEGTLMLFVACATFAARKRSWRTRLPAATARR